METLDIEHLIARGDLQPFPGLAGQIRVHQQPRREPIDIAFAELSPLLVGPALAEQIGGKVRGAALLWALLAKSPVAAIRRRVP